MATQNLFEKYGIKEVADVTFYRIEKKEETYESQREISVASILKGAIELRTVYPLEEGRGAEEGFEAYVFTDADILTGANYDCDDEIDVAGSLRVTYQSDEPVEEETIEAAVKENYLNLIKAALNKGALTDNFIKATALEFVDNSSKISISTAKIKDTEIEVEEGYTPQTDIVILNKAYTTSTQQYDITATIDLTNAELTINAPETVTLTLEEVGDGNKLNIVGNKADLQNQEGQGSGEIKVKVDNGAYNKTITFAYTNTGNVFNTVTPERQTVELKLASKATYYVSTVIVDGVFTSKNIDDLAHGVYEADNEATDPDAKKYPGTHEYSYAQQACILFARRQNIIAKTGVRYQFAQADTLFGEIEFNDEFTTAPNSTEKVVVVGLAGKLTESTYDIEEINEYIKTLTQTFSAKAYDVIYDDYAELVVEDEMGYYRPDFLGYAYHRDGGVGTMDAFETSYADWIAEDSNRILDPAIAYAQMWEDNKHYSINDAIEALRQKQKILDASEPGNANGVKSIFGGYKVSSKNTINDATPDVGEEDTLGTYGNEYQYSLEGEAAEVNDTDYPLASVLNAIGEITATMNALGKNLRVDYEGHVSNRAIYVPVDNVDTAAGAYIYLLHNKNYKRLSSDGEGIFQFEDKKGNTLYYQDLIFKGIEWLALVILGDKGLIFVVNRHGNTDNSRVAWMINENGYITDKRAAAVVKNGLIHTTDITVNDETFEATCTVKSLKIRKITKKTNHYIPVLFLDTLKVSTIEQTAEEVYATGGKGNANLIGWDYGKEITLSLQDALFTPASMSAIFGSYEGNDFTKGVKDVKTLDRFEKVTAKRSFIVPAGNSNGTPTEADKTAQAVFYDPNTMKPYPDGTPIAEGEIFYKFTRSVAYEGQSLGHMIEISADKFPGTYKVVGDTFVRSKDTGEDERFQFVIPQAKMTSEQTITLEADGDPTVFDMNMTVLRPEDGVMVKFIQYNVVENEEQNDGSDMVKDTEDLNLLDDAELFKVSGAGAQDLDAIGATEY